MTGGQSAPVPDRWLGGLDLGLIEAVFDLQPDQPFFVKDADLRYVAVNVSMMRLCGASVRADMLGRGAADFFPIEAARRYEEMDRQVLTTGSPLIDRLDLAGSERAPAHWLLFSRLPVKDAGQRTIGVIATARALPMRSRADQVYQRVAAVLDHVRLAYRHPLELNRLAVLAGVSPSQLERDVARVLGATLRDYHRRVRLEHAVAMLRTGAAVSAVAHESGYADHSAFTRQFRRAFGSTPMAFRSRDPASDPQ